MPLLTPERQTAFERDGFLVLRKFYDRSGTAPAPDPAPTRRHRPVARKRARTSPIRQFAGQPP